MALSSSIDHSVALVERLRAVAADGDTAELESGAAELAESLASVRREADAMEQRVTALETENRALKRAGGGTDEPVEVKNGCYRFQGDDALYCPLCWDNQRQKARTARITSRQRVCSTCRSPISA